MDGGALFWDIAERMIAAGAVEESTMMGRRCLRTDGSFVAMTDSKSGGLIVKLTAERVSEVISAGEGHRFAPAGKTFREWVLVPDPDELLWGQLLDEARRLAQA